MPNPGDIDAALIALLEADAPLRALLPDGVSFDKARQNSQRFVVVSLVMEDDIPEFGRCAYEDALYLVKAVALGTDGATAELGAARIHELLEDQPLTVEGYGWMTMHRESRVRLKEPDAVDAALVWQHFGGNYRVQMAVVHGGSA